MEDGLSRMRNALADALDQISSTRSSFETRARAFEAIEKQLAAAHSGSRDDRGKEALENFLALQYTFECNVPLRVLAWITSAAEKLEKLKESTEESHNLEAFILGSQLEQALTLIQGIALSHVASKAYLGRKYPVQVLVDLIPVSRYVPSSRRDADAKSQTLTASVLETLSCILVDSSPALRSFEEAGGPQAVVRLLKRSGTPRDVRIKTLEFLYFYLMDEDSPAAAQGIDNFAVSPLSESTPAPSPRKRTTTPPPTVPATPIRPSKRNLGLGPAPRRRPSSVYGSSTYGSNSEWQSPSSSLSAKAPLTPGSRSTSGSSTVSGASTSSNVSNSTAATSVASSPEKASALKLAIVTRDREKGRLSPKKRSSRTPAELALSPNGSTLSDGAIRTVPTTPTSSRNSSRHLLQTPVSSRASSRSDLATESKRERPFRFPAPMQPRMMLLQSDVDCEPISPVRALPSPFSPPPQTPVKSPIGLGRPGSRHAKSKSMSNVLSEASEASAAESKKVKRLGSAATVPIIMESPKKVAVPVPQRSATRHGSPAEKENGSTTKDGTRKMSVEDKKKLLGTMLTNVDALIEGVSKAGVWGLA